MTTLQDMYAAVDAAAQDHFQWCSDHDYVNEPDPRTQLCRTTYALEFPKTDGCSDDVSAITVDLAGSQSDVEHGFPVPQASIGFNGGFGERDFAPWKLQPIAFALLAAHARAAGDEARARAFMDAAQNAITEHVSQAEDEPVEYVVSEPARHWSQGPFNYVMVSRPDDEIITYDQYEVEQSLAAGIPQWVIQHAEDGRRYRVVGARDSVPVGDETYGEFAEAKPVRDRLNEQARRDATAEPAPDTQSAVYDIDDEVKALTGAFAGQLGVVDELDQADPERPFRVRFEDLDGEPVAWFHASQLEHIGAAA